MAAKSRTHKIAVEEAMTIYTASTQKLMLLEAVANCQELDLDLSQVAEMDSAGFQLLMLAKREAAKTYKTLRITAHSKAVRELLDLYNMGSYFGDQLVIPADEHGRAA
jgi:anti-anti-sigma factor